MIHLAYLQRYRLVVGQKRLGSRLEFYFDRNFLGGRAALEAKLSLLVELTDRDTEPQILFFYFFGLLTLRFGHMT